MRERGVREEEGAYRSKGVNRWRKSLSGPEAEEE